MWSRQQPTGRWRAFDIHLVAAVGLINMEEEQSKNAALCLFISALPASSLLTIRVSWNVSRQFILQHTVLLKHTQISVTYSGSELSPLQCISREALKSPKRTGTRFDDPSLSLRQVRSWQGGQLAAAAATRSAAKPVSLGLAQWDSPEKCVNYPEWKSKQKSIFGHIQPILHIL